MIYINQHRPAYIDWNTPPEHAECETLAALLAVPWVANFVDGGYDNKFDGYAWSEGLLLATYTLWDGTPTHYVIGYLEPPENPGLPEWKPK